MGEGCGFSLSHIGCHTLPIGGVHLNGGTWRDTCNQLAGTRLVSSHYLNAHSLLSCRCLVAVCLPTFPYTTYGRNIMLKESIIKNGCTYH